jgi:sulfate permease, SulP family
LAASATVRWNPRIAFSPAIRYLRQPVNLFESLNRENFRPDFIAGLTVGVVLLPQAIAFSLIAELPPQMGIYTAILAGIAGALWGSSNQLHTGPTNALSLLLLSTLAVTMVPGSPDYIVAAGLLTLMVGLLQLALGLLRFGVVVNFVSHSVIVGFATGAGVLIAVRQLGPLLGIQLSGANVLSNLASVFTGLLAIDSITAAIGIGTMVLIILLRRYNPRLPGPLIGMIAAALAVYALGDRAQDVAVIGELPRSLPPIAPLPVFNLDQIGRLSTGALAVAAIGLVQTTAISRAVATHTRQRLDSNQEFVGQGIANILAGVFSGYVASGSFSCTAVNLRAGGRTRMASLIASLFVLGAMLVLGPLAAYIPNTALAAVLIVTAYNMIDRAEILRIWRGAPGDAIIMVVTFLGTMFLDLDFAVLTGIMLSFILYLMRTSAPRVQVVVPDENFRHFVHRPDADTCPQLGIVDIMGDLYFGAVNHVEEEILHLATKYPEQRYLLVRMGHVNQIDFSGIHMLENVIRTYRDRGGDVYLVNVGRYPHHLMETTGCLDYLGSQNILNEDKAIDHIFHRVLDPAICIYECPVRVFRECQNLPKRTDLLSALDHADLVAGYKGITGAGDLATMPPLALQRRLRQNPPDEQPVIIDVREPREYKRSHIAEAQSVPLSTLLRNGLVLSGDRPLVVVCQAGRRSRRAASILKSMGYKDVAILEGGMQAWESAGFLTAVEFDPIL